MIIDHRLLAWFGQSLLLDASWELGGLVCSASEHDIVRRQAGASGFSGGRYWCSLLLPHFWHPEADPGFATPQLFAWTWEELA